MATLLWNPDRFYWRLIAAAGAGRVAGPRREIIFQRGISIARDTCQLHLSASPVTTLSTGRIPRRRARDEAITASPRSVLQTRRSRVFNSDRGGFIIIPWKFIKTRNQGACPRGGEGDRERRGGISRVRAFGAGDVM